MLCLSDEDDDEEDLDDFVVVLDEDDDEDGKLNIWIKFIDCKRNLIDL